ncbi:MAG: helix-turn-helix domain-containing protein [Desulfobacterales bacterium]|nr:helix-turn-helix domain-containing protein [Desulfobacterales bacterium]
MKKVTIFCPYNTMATTIFGPMDVLSQAGRLWNRMVKSAATPFFEVTLVSADGLPIRSLNNIMIEPHCSITEVDNTDLIVIASATYIDKILEMNPEILPWLITHYQKGTHIASICTGVFLLAETGLLNGKTATLHWGFADDFSKKYPKIKLDHGKMFIDHGRLYCSAGVSAGMDLSLYLVEKFYGRESALAAAKTMVLDISRTTQTPYACFLPATSHRDELILKIQNWMSEHHSRHVNYDTLAHHFSISRRSLERRFKKATGLTPLAYLQKLRVEKAKQLLEQGVKPFSEITYAVGYEDIPFFRKVFTRTTGLLPKAYQQKFRVW